MINKVIKLTQYEKGKMDGWNGALLKLHEKGIIDVDALNAFRIPEDVIESRGNGQCETTVKELQEFIARWRAYFLDFMNRTIDYQVTDPLQMRDLVDELSIQLGAFMGW